MSNKLSLDRGEEQKMRRILKKYNNLSIRIKFISIVLSALLVFGGICMIGLQIISRSSQALLHKTLASSLSYSVTELSGSLKEMEALSLNIATDMAVQDQLGAVAVAPDDMLIRSRAFRQLNTTLLNYYEQNKAIWFIGIGNEHIQISTNTAREQKVGAEAWLIMEEAARQAEGRIRWFYHPDHPESLFAIRQIRQISSYRLDALGTVCIQVNMEEMVKNGTNLAARFGEPYYLLTDGRNVLFETDCFPREVMGELEGLEENEYRIVRREGRRYFAVVGMVPDYGWKYINLLSYDDMHRAMMKSIWLFAGVLLLGGCLAVLLCSVLIKQITAHISALMVKMQEFSQDNTGVPDTGYDYSEREDEIGKIHRKFDEMAVQLIDLIQNDYLNQILMKDAKLRALEAQMDPHFLYNVLQSISWSAKVIGDRQIPMMVDALGKMLRTVLSPEDEIFTIQKEVEFVNHYMVIQQSRFEGNLFFELHIQEEILPVQVPKLIIQPLVENAIRYSMEGSDEICRIRVDGWLAKGQILLTVKNTGSLFAADFQEKLETNQVQPGGFGIGLLNIKQRLSLMYGEESCLKLYNEDGWAVACICISYPFPPNAREGEFHCERRENSV